MSTRIFYPGLVVSRSDTVMSVQSRPGGLTFLASLAFLAGILLLFAGSTIGLQLGTSTDGLQFIGLFIAYAFGCYAIQLPNNLFALGILVLAVLYLGAGMGLLFKRLWGWTVGVALSIAGIIMLLLQASISSWTALASPLSWLGLTIYPYILFYLVTPSVRRLFTKNTSVKSPPTQA